VTAAIVWASVGFVPVGVVNAIVAPFSLPLLVLAMLLPGLMGVSYLSQRAMAALTIGCVAGTLAFCAVATWSPVTAITDEVPTPMRSAILILGVPAIAALLVFVYVGHFSYRSYSIHIGTLFGTTMAFNVWFRIWPSQQKIIAAVKNGAAPDAALVTLAGMRSRHNTYMSVPLLWTMINNHTAGTWFSTLSWMGLLGMILLGWHVVFQLYQKSTKIQGF